MNKFYQKMYATSGSRAFQNYVRQGCFTSKFTRVLFECNPASEKMKLLQQIASMDYFSQVQFYIRHNSESLKQLFVLRNISNEDIFAAKKDNATIFDDDSGNDDG